MSKTAGSDNRAKPFLKWAGGKSQLLHPIMDAMDTALKDAASFNYIEPFVGSGAVFFEVMSHYKDKVKKALINDRNADLMQAYRMIRDDLETLLAALDELKRAYEVAPNELSRKNLYYDVRDRFNKREAEAPEHAAMMIFLNKTCYNGLYRVNSSNEFNVPFGKYKNPGIFDKSKLEALSILLRDVTILNLDFDELLPFAERQSKTFVYLDPPYRPISATSSFNAYSMSAFNDDEQRRLKVFCDKLTQKGARWLLSNSDPTNSRADDTFFDELYAGYYVDRVKARRCINSNASKRGAIRELLISNFPVKQGAD